MYYVVIDVNVEVTRGWMRYGALLRAIRVF